MRPNDCSPIKVLQKRRTSACAMMTAVFDREELQQLQTKGKEMKKKLH